MTELKYKTAKELARLSRVRNQHVKRLRKKGKSADYIKSYLRGWSTDHYRLKK
jgi:hypothetical protein